MPRVILVDFECANPTCGTIFEELAAPAQEFMFCPACGSRAKRIISVSGAYLGNQDAKWIRESAEALVDKEAAVHSKDPLERQLATNPTREAVRAYMQQKGLRYFENQGGAPPRWKRPKEPDTSGRTERMWRKLQEMRRMEVRG